jgi:hypothetical protein
MYRCINYLFKKPPALITIQRFRLSLAIIPNTKENLPPFNTVSYDRTVPLLPKISFSMIYEFIVTRTTASGTCASNFKGLDRDHSLGDAKGKHGYN